MKKFLLFSSILCALASAIFLYYLSETPLYRPGDRLYPLQLQAETWRLHLNPGAAARFRWAVERVERRLFDLGVSSRRDDIQQALAGLEGAISDAIRIHAALPAEAHRSLPVRLQAVLNQAEVILGDLPDEKASYLLARLHLEFGQAGKIKVSASPLVAHNPAIPAVSIRFLGPVAHMETILDGAHRQVACLDCHSEGLYAGTPRSCTACHPAPSVTPLSGAVYRIRAGGGTGSLYAELEQHYAGECSDCHNQLNWVPDRFNHRGIGECRACHAQDTPEAYGFQELPFVTSLFERTQTVRSAHYPGDCRDCHLDTADWSSTAYRHSWGQDCDACHAVDQPAEHFAGRCASCHTDTQAWTEGVQFDHRGYVDCRYCHFPEAGHYIEDCILCHIPTRWEPRFDHERFGECAVCHTPEDVHYAGECDDCHSSQTWSDGGYVHTDDPDCQRCHAQVDIHAVSACYTCHLAPRGHYPQACNECHTPQGWLEITYIHTENSYCLNCHVTPDAHWPGTCITCHRLDTWGVEAVDHSLFFDCEACHAPIYGHWPGECINCHTTITWLEVTFDHTNYTDCKACHPRPADHKTGQCSKCHTTIDWTPIPTPTPPPPPTPAPTDTPLPTQDPLTPTPEPVEATPTPSPAPPEPELTATPSPTPELPEETATSLPPTATSTPAPTEEPTLP